MSERNLVICCDGTSNKFGSKNTNVVRLLQCLQRDTHAQIIYYDPGVGTLPDANRVTAMGKWWSRIIGLAFGYGLTADVMQAYAFLMEHWKPGDRVYIFGFSRGAYTARVLAGLLHAFGLLPRGGHNMLPYVLEGYKALSSRNKRDEMPKLDEVYRDFRRTFARSVNESDEERHFPVHFLGVWDTVSTVGWVWDPKSFRHTAFNPSVQFARHAIALDERRTFFRQNRLASAQTRSGEAYSAQIDGKRRTVECWFPGSHCDVGGGHSGDEDQLWPLSLHWLLEEAAEVKLLVDSVRRKAIFQDRDLSEVCKLKHHESLEGPWKYAEHFPALRWRKDDKSGEWHARFETGDGTPRKVRPGELIHRSALERLRAENVILPGGEMGRYDPPSLCVKYKKDVLQMTDPLPEYHAYAPANCAVGCEACARLKA